MKRWGKMKKPASKQISSEGDQDQPDQDFQPGSFFFCVYQKDWYLGQKVPKRANPESVEGDKYLIVNFMCQCSASEDGFRWSKFDVLNVLKEDLLEPYLSHFD
jgi:hypothetical protein